LDLEVEMAKPFAAVVLLAAWCVPAASSATGFSPIESTASGAAVVEHLASLGFEPDESAPITERQGDTTVHCLGIAALPGKAAQPVGAKLPIALFVVEKANAPATHAIMWADRSSGDTQLYFDARSAQDPSRVLRLRFSRSGESDGSRKVALSEVAPDGLTERPFANVFDGPQGALRVEEILQVGCFRACFTIVGVGFTVFTTIWLVGCLIGAGLPGVLAGAATAGAALAAIWPLFKICAGPAIFRLGSTIGALIGCWLGC
jgi:hypothetical protein